nr:hypothetical transcript [Hymenolepis microstoma]
MTLVSCSNVCLQELAISVHARLLIVGEIHQSLISQSPAWSRRQKEDARKPQFENRAAKPPPTNVTNYKEHISASERQAALPSTLASKSLTSDIVNSFVAIPFASLPKPSYACGSQRFTV